MALLPAALPLQAQERQPADQETTQEGRRVHVVRQGDTLWDLASFYLEDPFLWPEIYRLNTVVVEDPHWIYPAEELVLPGPGEVRPPPAEEPVPGDEVAVREPIPEPEVRPIPEEPGARTIFVAPDLQRTTLTYQPTQPVPAVSVTRFDYHRAGMLIPLAELGPRGEIVDVTHPRGFGVEPQDIVHRFGRIYVSHGDDEPPQPGDRILLFRIERQVKPYGHIVRPTGLATIAAVHQEVSTAIVVELFDRVLIGDQTVEAETFETQPGVFAEPVATGPAGELVAIMDRQPVVSSEDMVFIDLGANQGINVGDEFQIFIGTRESRSGYELPEEHIGTGRVVRLTDETATLRLIEMRHPTVDVGLPVRLVRRMPTS